MPISTRPGVFSLHPALAFFKSQRLRMALMVCFCGCIAVTSSLAQRAPSAIPDEIFYNGKVIMVDPSFRIAEAFALLGDTFLAVGSNASIKALARPRTRMVDLKGHAVIPGLIDNHTHQYNAALIEFRGVDLVA